MNTIFDTDKRKNKDSKPKAWHAGRFMKKDSTDFICIYKAKKGKNKTKHHCQNNCKSKSCFGSINYSCSFFFRSDLRKCNLKSLKADRKPKKIYRKDQLINSNLMCTNHPCKKYSIIESNEP